MSNFALPLQKFILAVILITVFVNSVQGQTTADDAFQSYLEEVFNNYTNWVKENGLDPSPSTDTVIKSGNMDNIPRNISFNCELTNHYVVGHSDSDYYFKLISNFEKHVFMMTYDSIFPTCSYHGEFNCTGILFSQYFPELEKNLHFSGHGKFNITPENLVEMLDVANVGITQDHKLDLTYAVETFLLHNFLDVYSIVMEAEWNDTRIEETYFDPVQQLFGRLYWNYNFYYNISTPAYPHAHLLDRYVRETFQDFDLKQIIDSEDLPEPFFPTPKPVTTTESVKEAEENLEFKSK